MNTKFTDIFIKRPVLATVVSLVILVLGLRSIGLLPMLQYPYTQNAVVTVITAGVLLAVTALAPVERISFDLGHLLHACPEQLRRRYQFLHGTGVPLVSLAIASGVAFVVFRATVVQDGHTVFEFFDKDSLKQVR